MSEEAALLLFARAMATVLITFGASALIAAFVDYQAHRARIDTDRKENVR